jgi:hypothetical protein
MCFALPPVDFHAELATCCSVELVMLTLFQLIWVVMDEDSLLLDLK